MAIKSRILKNLIESKNNMLFAVDKKDASFFEFALNNLYIAKETCQNGLTEKNYIAYDEIYKGLLQSLQNLTKVGEVEELINLSLELLNYLITEIQKETNFKKEIVFLPIQAAMWDSLESVWKEANEDTEHCAAYVVPLPYADLNDDHSVKEWHCEKDKYPKYVPVIDYKNINLKEMHPDIIFINNPYDAYNRVTAVDEKYYSDVLKECTDKLIYIPYFIIDEDADITEETISEFAVKPGVYYADLTIVQSEKIKEFYIDALTHQTEKTDRNYWNNKIIAAGSPKIDKVVNSKKEDYELPEKWQKLIEGKKVILYNTSVVPHIKNADKILDKMEYVFNTFKNRNDVALWWRPHPLLKQTLHTMRPHILEKYTKLEQEYIKEGWGIYDDSGDLHRAVCYSDAYYGDQSSVVTLYKYTDKPIMLQNFNVVNEKNNLFFAI